MKIPSKLITLTLVACVMIFAGSGCAKAEDKSLTKSDDAIHWGGPQPDDQAAAQTSPSASMQPAAAAGSIYDDDLHSMFDEMNRMHQAMLNSMGGLGMGGGWTRPSRPSLYSMLTPDMSADVIETDKEHIITCELPGVSKEDIKIDVDGDTLVIQAVRNAGTDKAGDENGQTYHYRERSYGTTQRRFSVGYGVDPKKIKASLKDGILTIRVPKGEAKSVATIPIE